MSDKKITQLQLRSNVNDDVNFPVDDGIQTYRVTAPQVATYISSKFGQSTDAQNYSLAASVGSNALTIALKNAAGSNASSTSPVNISFRSGTLTSGLQATVSLSASLSTVISSGSTAGHRDGLPGELHIYAINNSGAIELAWSTSNKWDEGKLYTTTAEAGNADDSETLYSTTARTGVAIRYLGRMISTQTTAGTWASVPTDISSTRLVKMDAPIFLSAKILSSYACTTPNPVIFEDVNEDSHSIYDYTTGIWKMPRAALIDIKVGLYFNTAPGNHKINVNGTNIAYITNIPIGGTHHGGYVMRAEKDDEIYLNSDQSGTYLGNVPWTNWLTVHEIR